MRFPLWLKVKAATIEAIREAGGNKVCAAAVTRIDRVATFSDYGNEAEIKRVIPLDTAVELDAFNMRAGRAPRLIGLAAAELGYFLARAPQAAAAPCDVTGLCRVAKESADAISAMSAAMTDGEITALEARTVLKEIEDAQAAFASLTARLLKVAGEGASGGARVAPELRDDGDGEAQ
jgi:hypothetical protein